MLRAPVKVARDLWLTRGRVAFMVLALASGLTSVGTVLSMRSVLQREMQRAYAASVPASATFDVGEQGIDDATLAALRQLPEVSVAERRSTRTARWRPPGTTEWNRALLFMLEDFDRPQLARLGHERGQRVPPPGSVLVERSAMPVLGAELGDSIEVTTRAGQVASLEIVGVVHEPALAPAVTEQAGYLYASTETLALLGESPVLDEVRILVAEEPLDRGAIESQAGVIFEWLNARGVTVHEVKIPTPGAHPHQAPSNVVLSLFAFFASLTVALAAILCASLLSITMGRQVREIGVMKALGATNAQIRRIYVGMLLTVGALAVVASGPPTHLLADAGISTVSGLLNFDIVDDSVPHWVFVVQILMGLTLPLLAAAPAIISASRVSVQDALREHGARAPKAGPGERLSRLVAGGSRILRAALRNALRVPRRLALTVALLAVGGSLFICAVSVADGWDALTEEVYATRHYDAEFHLGGPADATVMRALSGAERVERWGFAPVTRVTPAGLPLSRTYPDGGHGSFTMVGVPLDTELIDFNLRDGRWLSSDDPGSVVLNQLAAARLQGDPVGQTVALVVEGRRSRWTVGGVVEEVAAPATAYVSSEAFTERAGGALRGVRLAAGTGHESAGTRAALATYENALSEVGVVVVSSVPLELLYNAMGEHVVVLIRSLVGLALLMAFVSILALGANMSTSVIERTREFGVLQAIGARPRQIRAMVLMEGLFVTALSLPLALLLAVPLAAGVGYVVGNLSFAIPLPLDLSWSAVGVWSLGALLVAATASFMPARAATRRSVRAALGTV